MSLVELLAQNQPQFQTHRALLVIGLQNDFIQPDGRLPVSTSSGFLDHIKALVPKFRRHSSGVIWVQTIYEADRVATDPSIGEGDAVVVGGLVDGLVESSTDDEDDILKTPIQSKSAKHKQRALDLLKRVSARRRTLPRDEAQAAAEEDEELFLLRTSKKGAGCLPNTPGADFVDSVKPVIEPLDTVVQTSHYSAFQGTSLLLNLRAKLVTELYICGCITNVSVLATVIDAARHGLKINIVEDCLGYRRQPRHDITLKRMAEFFDAYVVKSTDVLNEDPSDPVRHQPVPESNPPKSLVDKLEDLVGKLEIGDDGLGQQPQARSSKSSLSRNEFPAITINGHQRTPSDVSKAESRLTTETRLSDDQFADMLTQGAKFEVDERDKAPPPKQNLVKSKIRMRARGSKSKPEEDKKRKGEGKKGESSRQAAAETATNPVKQSAPAAPAVESPRIAKAESSDKLRESPSRRQPSLKSSVSQPALSSAVLESKEKSSSRLRLALSRSPKSDPKISPTQPPISPAKIPVEAEDTPPHSRTPSASSTPKPPPRSPARPPPEPPIAPLKPPSRSTLDIVGPARPTAKTAPEDSIAPSKASIQDTPNSTSTPLKSPTKSLLATSRSSPSSSLPAAMVSKKLQSLATFPIKGPGDIIAEGDSRIIYDFFPPDYKHPTDPSQPLKDLIFQQLYNEIRWQKMLHQTGEVPRLVCCQGAFAADGSMPVYRHPTDQALPLLQFSPKVKVIQRQAEKLVGHPLNHVLIQLYRSGQDFISEHSDKTLDIVKGSSIVNVSFGAQRTMRLRTKRAEKAEDSAERTTQRVAMPHNSMFVLGLKSNQRWLHGIQPDKRLKHERSEVEEAYGGARISLTFRNIGTFLDAKESRIWGQGATAKDQRDAQDVINDDEDENENVVRAFSRENHQPEFDWDEWYGAGFDVLHFRNPPEDIPILFASNNTVENRIVQIFLAETKINHIYLEAPPLEKPYEQGRQICYRDNDVNHTQVVNALSIISYLSQYHPIDRDERGRACAAASCGIFETVSTLLKFWKTGDESMSRDDFVSIVDSLEDRLSYGPGPFIAGRRFSVGDCAAWPALDEIITNWKGWSEQRFPLLTEYYKMLWKKKKSVAKLRAELPKIRKVAEHSTEKKEDTEELTQKLAGVKLRNSDEEGD